MNIVIQRDSGARGRQRSVSQQIADGILAEIERGELSPGARLPAIRSLARELGVNRDTVALAYESLAGSGVLESTVGRGTFVARSQTSDLAETAPFDPPISAATERLLRFERARPHFGSGQDAVPMHALIPDPSLYPAEEFRRTLNRVMMEAGSDLLLYGDPQGHPRLRSVMAERLGAGGIEVGADEILLCHGASQGISLAVRLFTEPGDVVAMEEPTYNNVLATVLGLGLRTAPVAMREEGLDLSALERVLSRPDVKLLYTIPTFHNPMGTSTSLEHRAQLLRIAERCGKPVIEDGFEMDLAIDGRPPKPLAGLDSSGLVIHLSSFSKSLFPGVRVGGIVARHRALDALLALKRATDHSDAIPLQAALAEFVDNGAYEKHLGRLRPVLRSRRDALLEALEAWMPEGTTWTRPQGGYQVWVSLPGEIDTADLLADALAAGVLFSPGSQFFHDGRASRGLRLSFAMPDEEALRRGVAALAEVVRARLAAAPGREARVHM
ncbi:PLP-dependent aminotransferase family protein [Myxococcota bacterium]|nr:PLP-dependent aminotransferase family protein [Myxococcota bacterium]